MKKGLDNIVFENRYEIKNIVNALEVYISEHKSDEELNTIKKLSDLCEDIYFNW